MRLHPSRPTLLAYDAGELDPRRMRRVADHLGDCVRCRGALVRRRELRAVAVQVTSARAPDVLPSIRARLDAGESLLLPIPSLRARARESRGWRVAWAAGVAFLVLVGSAAAATGLVDLRPVARWVGLGDRVGESPPGGVEVAVSGVEVEVPPSGLRIFLVEVGEAVTLDLRWTEGSRVEVTGRGAASEAGFRVGGGEVTVLDAPAGEIRLAVPRSAAGTVRIVVASRVVAVLRGGRVVLRGREAVPEARMTVGDLKNGGGP